MRAYVYLFIPLIVVIAGCSGISIPGFGTDVIQVTSNTVQDGTKDVLIINDPFTNPNSPLLPNQPVLFSFVLENRDQLANIKNVKVDLFDAPVFKSNIEGDSLFVGPDTKYLECNSPAKPCYPSKCAANSPCDVLPGEQVPIDFKLLTYDDTEIANIQTKTRLSYKVNYDFLSSFFYQFPAVTQDEILKRQQSSDVLQLSTSKSVSSGPIQIDADLQGQSFMLAGYPATIDFTIKDVGDGNTVGSTIKQGCMAIAFPDGLEIHPSQGDMFKCDGSAPACQTEESNEEKSFIEKFLDFGKKVFGADDNAEGIFPSNSQVCYNAKGIDLYKDESQISLRFDINVRNDVQVDPYKTFEIRSFVIYTYELRKFMDVTINPYGNS